MFRSHAKTTKIGDRAIGGGNPVLIQLMYNTKTKDINTTVNQIRRLEQTDCDIIRVAIPAMEAARASSYIRKEIHTLLVADIHFDYHLAIVSIGNGADKIHTNLGNIGDREKVKAVADRVRGYDIPIRVGVNSGSLEKSLLGKYGGVTTEGTVESAPDKIRLIEDTEYGNLVTSIESLDVMTCVKAHELVASRTGYPPHVGIMESGALSSGNTKPSMGLGVILCQGIGGTIRVSLTGDPVGETKSAKLILCTLGSRSGGIEVVSRPTYGRTRIDLIGLVNRMEVMASEFDDLDAKVAVTGYVVDGPGEAGEAGIGTTSGADEDPLIEKGEVTQKIPGVELLSVLRPELESMWP